MGGYCVNVSTSSEPWTGTTQAIYIKMQTCFYEPYTPNFLYTFQLANAQATCITALKQHIIQLVVVFRLCSWAWSKMSMAKKLVAFNVVLICLYWLIDSLLNNDPVPPKSDPPDGLHSHPCVGGRDPCGSCWSCAQATSNKRNNPDRSKEQTHNWNGDGNNITITMIMMSDQRNINEVRRYIEVSITHAKININQNNWEHARA